MPTAPTGRTWRETATVWWRFFRRFRFNYAISLCLALATKPIHDSIDYDSAFQVGLFWSIYMSLQIAVYYGVRRLRLRSAERRRAFCRQRRQMRRSMLQEPIDIDDTDITAHLRMRGPEAKKQRVARANARSRREARRQTMHDEIRGAIRR
jgi:hypothetical protein